MSESPDVDALEQDVEQARTRLATTLDRITSPETIETAKSELMGYAQTAKNEVAEYATKAKEEVADYVTKTKTEALETAQQKARSFAEDLQERARANPVAVGLIGAGIAWRLYKHPPITTLLVGAGVALLMKGPARRGGKVHSDPYDDTRPTSYVPGGVAGFGYPAEDGGLAGQAAAAASRTSEFAQDAAARAREFASDTAARLSQAASEGAERVSEFASDAADRVGHMASDAAARARRATYEGGDRAGQVAGETGSTLSEAASRSAVSVATVVDEMVENAGRYAQTARENPYVLGGLGVAAGIALWRIAAGTEAGSRALDSTGRSVRTRARDLSDAAGHAAHRVGATASEIAATARDTVSSGVSQALGAVGDVPSSLGRVASNVAGATSQALGSFSTASSSGDEDASHSRAVRHSGRRPPRSVHRESPVARWFTDEVLGMSQRYPVLVGVIGLSLGAVVGGSMRLTDTERRVAGPLSEAAKRRVLEAVDEGYGEVRSSAERVAEQLKAGLGETSAREDQSADFETVLGGGPPPAGGQGVGAPASSGGSRPAAAPAKDMSADFERVLGGGPPPVEERQATSASPSAGSPAGTAGKARLRPGGSSSF